MKKGGGFEKIIEKMLHRADFGLVVATEPPVRVLKSVGKGTFLVYFESPGILDFAGPKGGRHIEFDCKDIGSNLFSFTKIKTHQWLRMKELAVDGSITGIVLRMRGTSANSDKVYGLPAHVLLDAREAGKKSFNKGRLEQLAEDGEIARIEYFKSAGLIDFFNKAATLKYILPANHFKRGWGMRWKLRKTDSAGQWDGLSSGS